MFNIWQIAKKNRETFYNYSTDEPLNLRPSRIVKGGIAFFLVLLFPNVGKDFLGTILAVYSILIGFSFNVLFYLLSIRKLYPSSQADSLEKQIKYEKLNRLRDELFYNVSYFSICAISLVIISLTFFLFDSFSRKFVEYLPWASTLKNLIQEYSVALSYISVLISHFYKFVFYVLLIESMYSFIRTIGRVSFYFEEKIKLQTKK